MKLELLILGSTIFLIYNTYHEGKYLKMIYSYKKYFQMAFLALIGFSLYLLIKRNPAKTKNILLCANNMVKYMPIDKSTMDLSGEEIKLKFLNLDITDVTSMKFHYILTYPAFSYLSFSCYYSQHSKFAPGLF